MGNSLQTLRKSPEALIRGRIASQGKITFAEFMEIVLYEPSGGYYSSASPLGASGDYFTSPAAHPAFGALIAVQLSRMWLALGRPHRFLAVEMGAGDGLLARDVVDYAGRLSYAFAKSLTYIAIDRSPARTRRYGAGRIHRLVSDGVPLSGVVGCFISNELLDSFPAHRFRVSGGAIMEIYVTLDERGEFAEVLGEPSTPLLADRLAGLGLALPEGYRGEVNLNVRPWLECVSAALERGFVLTIDYGYPAHELYSSQRARGTLQTYYRHTDGGSPFQQIGRRDITAHVDFSTVAYEGRSLGLNSLGLRTQSQFLADLGFHGLVEGLRRMKLGYRERSANMMALLELVKPEGLGRFGAMIQERRTGVKSVNQLNLGNEALPEPPLLSDDHVPLLAGRYPETAWNMDQLWPFAEDETVSEEGAIC